MISIVIHNIIIKYLPCGESCINAPGNIHLCPDLKGKRFVNIFSMFLLYDCG